VVAPGRSAPVVNVQAFVLDGADRAAQWARIGADVQSLGGDLLEGAGPIDGSRTTLLLWSDASDP
jgi:hypothetical protein